MRRLEVKEQDSYNFNSVIKGKSKLCSGIPVLRAQLDATSITYITCLSYMAEYKAICDSCQISVNYARSCCLRVCIASNKILMGKQYIFGLYLLFNYCLL